MSDLSVLRVDDLPLLYEEIRSLGVQEIVDSKVSVHGNRAGLSLGHLVSLWLCYMLSESDHRLSSVEEWASTNLVVLKSLSGQYELRAKDFTDDRLEQALDYLSPDLEWLGISNALNARSLSVYQLDEDQTVRLDAAPMQGHHQVEPGGLFQYGYSKHHNGQLGQLKVKLASMDNALNGFGYPLAHLVVSGEQSDDQLYIPILAQCEATFAHAGHSGRKLYVGDSKMGSKEIRDYIVQSGNDYLLPLSKKQLSQAQRVQQIEAHQASTYQKVYKTDKKGKRKLVAQGFEGRITRSYIHQGQSHQYTERQIFVLSTTYAQSAQKALDRHLAEAEETLTQLLIPKQGKQLPKTEAELQEKIQEILSGKGLQKLLEVSIEAQEQHRKIRPYKDRPARVESTTTFLLDIQRNEQAIEAHKQTLGWQVYATTVSQEQLPLEACVWKYRQQNRVESRFHDLRNKVVPLLPIFLEKDHRIQALIHLLMICLKVCAMIEYKIAYQLSQDQQELDQIFEGNPKKATKTPTAKRLLRKFRGISVVIMPQQRTKLPKVMITQLSPIQLKILDLGGFNPDIYHNLPYKINLYFSQLQISET